MKRFKQYVHEKEPSSLEAVVHTNTEFALELYQELRAVEGSLVFSPYSISTALAMVYAGARGDTEKQMAQALRFGLDQKRFHAASACLDAKLKLVKEKGHILLQSANTLWPQAGCPLLDEFLALIKESYGASVITVDYSNPEKARRKINAWVEENTQEMIREMIPLGFLDAMTRLVLVNAIYFKGNWKSQFDRDLTCDAPFWVTPNEQLQAPMMTQRHKFRYGESADLQILELPYDGDDLSMTVLLPKETDGLARLEQSFTVKNLDRWTRNLRAMEVIVFLPVFEITFPFRLDDTLKAMGMVDAFSGQADFSGMDKAPLFISAILHKAFIAVNEEGTEAAAATAAVMARSLPLPAPTFRADHPFIYLIRENSTGVILFLGRVVNPTSHAA